MHLKQVGIFFAALVAGTVTQYTFPKDFKFGVATSSYQVEGGWNADGKGEGLWDYFTHTFPNKILDKSNGDVACDSYNKVEEDLKNLKDLKVDFYRISLSWPRILPSGFPNQVNKAGVDYYNRLIDGLLENGIEPVVTLFHWDLPQKLFELGGWTNFEMSKYFADYARICFQLFGDRVKTWITINEPTSICRLGYGTAAMAPFYKFSGIADYTCGHSILLAHGRAYEVYTNEFKHTQRGRIGFTLESPWFEPHTDSEEDRQASENLLQSYASNKLGWFAHPVFSKSGDYPKLMRATIDHLSKLQNFTRSRLPVFTDEEVQMLKGSADFFGLNHYTTTYAKQPPKPCNTSIPSEAGDKCVLVFPDPDWEPTAKPDFYIVPWGLRKLINWVKREYANVEVSITENGYAGVQDAGLDDPGRIKYLKEYLSEVSKAISEDGCNVTGYTFWSFMDNFEWADGYTTTFGLYHVDFSSANRTRSPRKSASVYREIIATKQIN